MVAMTAIANLQYTWTLFTLPLFEGLQAKLSDVQLAFTLFILTQSWLVRFDGYLVDRLGACIVVFVGGLLVGLGWVGSGLADSLPALYVCYVLGGISVGTLYGACVGAALKWFPDRCGLAAGLVIGAYGSGPVLTVIPFSASLHRTGKKLSSLPEGLSRQSWSWRWPGS